MNFISFKKMFFVPMILAVSILHGAAESAENRIASLLNYVSYSTARITESRNRGLLETEFQNVLTNIEPSSLKNPELINEYEYLLNTITDLTLSANERKHLEKAAEQKRRNAIFNSLNSLGSILYVPSKDPVSLGISLGYAAINAGFNYARTVNDIEIDLEEKNFQLDQKDLQTIKGQWTSLFTSSAKIYGKSNFSSEKLINPEEMKSFAAIDSLLESTSDSVEVKKIASRNIPTLEKMNGNFKNFSPYWLALGKSYYHTEKFSKAMECFENVLELDSASSVFKNRKSPYVKEAAKYSVFLELKTGGKSLRKHIELLKRNSLLDQISQDDLSYFLFSAYLSQKDFESAKNELDFLKQRGLESDFGSLGCTFDMLTTRANTLENKRAVAMLQSLTEINFGFTEDLEEIFASDKELKKQEKNIFFTSGIPLSSFDFKMMDSGFQKEKNSSFAKKIYTDASAWIRKKADKKPAMNEIRSRQISLDGKDFSLNVASDLGWDKLTDGGCITLETENAVFAYMISDGKDFSSLAAKNLSYKSGFIKTKSETTQIATCLVGVKVKNGIFYYMPNTETGKWTSIEN